MPDIHLLTQLDSQAHAQAQGGPSKSHVSRPVKQWNIRAAPAVARSRNPIRETLAFVTGVPPQTSKHFINLGLGDPTHYPLHPPPPAATSAVEKALKSGRANGYLNGIGSLEARKAVADYHQRWDRVQYDTEAIVLTHGVSHALDLLFSILLPPASVARANILLPRPGFAAYGNLLANLGTEIRYYDLIEENDWEADLGMIDNLCDDETKAILVTNPSNPCGSNYSKAHLANIVALAEKHKVPLIADEIYGHMTWTAQFHPLAALSTQVPVFTLSGLSKRFLLPGWRFGWIALHDPLGVAGELQGGMRAWGNRFMGPNSLLQSALPEILSTPPEWFDEVTDKIKLNASITHAAVAEIPGLSASEPSGALYMLVRVSPTLFPLLADDVAFAAALYREEAVFVLPGTCFEAPGYIRLVLGAPAEIMSETMERINEFCNRHLQT